MKPKIFFLFTLCVLLFTSCNKESISFSTEDANVISINQALKTLDSTLELIDLETKAEPKRSVANSDNILTRRVLSKIFIVRVSDSERLSDFHNSFIMFN